MCGRYVSRNQAAIERYFNVNKVRNPLIDRFNVSPSQDVPVIPPGRGERVMSPMRWGLILSWAQDVKIGYKTINARARRSSPNPPSGPPIKPDVSNPSKRLLRSGSATLIRRFRITSTSPTTSRWLSPGYGNLGTRRWPAGVLYDRHHRSQWHDGGTAQPHAGDTGCAGFRLVDEWRCPGGRATAAAVSIGVVAGISGQPAGQQFKASGTRTD